MVEVDFEDFRKTGLLLLVNQFLHIFGFALVAECDDEKVFCRIYMARVHFRGFDEKSTSNAYVAVSEYMRVEAEKLLEEAKS